jgi:phosphatidylinositol-3-phosphatase
VEWLTMRILILAMTLIVSFGTYAESVVLPRPNHIVIVFEEDRSFRQVIGNKKVPYINSLAQRGALFTNSFGITHPSLPNYIAFFSGSTHRVRSARTGRVSPPSRTWAVLFLRAG